MKWRKWNRIIHRDLGYFFFGATIIYGLSGIALNHLNDWNPSYIISNKKIEIHQKLNPENIDKKSVVRLLEDFNEDKNYKKHYFPSEDKLKIFLKNGSAEINLENGKGNIEKIIKRPVFYEVNYLHYNPSKYYWTLYSDIFAGSLILLAITGLFIIRGKKGITGRGAWLTTAGILIPILYLIFLL